MKPAGIILGPKAAIAAIAAGLLLGGCYYPYGYSAYPPYPGYGSPTVPMTYAQREFTLPQGASGTAVASAPGVTYSTEQVPAQYAQSTQSADYFANYYATPAYDYYPYPAYPYAYPYPYAGYPAYYGYPAVSIGFGYWGGGGCCWGHGWHGGGWNHGWHGGGGGWHGGGSSWQSGGGWHGGGGHMR